MSSSLNCTISKRPVWSAWNWMQFLLLLLVQKTHLLFIYAVDLFIQQRRRHQKYDFKRSCQAQWDDNSWRHNLREFFFQNSPCFQMFGHEWMLLRMNSEKKAISPNGCLHFGIFGGSSSDGGWKRGSDLMAQWLTQLGLKRWTLIIIARLLFRHLYRNQTRLKIVSARSSEVFYDPQGKCWPFSKWKAISVPDAAFSIDLIIVLLFLTP